MNSHLKEIISKENAEKKTTFYNEALNETYARIEALEQREKHMLNSLQVTMREHSMLTGAEKAGKLSTDLVD